MNIFKRFLEWKNAFIKRKQEEQFLSGYDFCMGVLMRNHCRFPDDQKAVLGAIDCMESHADAAQFHQGSHFDRGIRHAIIDFRITFKLSES